jgi:hypothetical protein
MLPMNARIDDVEFPHLVRLHVVSSNVPQPSADSESNNPAGPDKENQVEPGRATKRQKCDAPVPQVTSSAGRAPLADCAPNAEPGSVPGAHASSETTRLSQEYAPRSDSVREESVVTSDPVSTCPSSGHAPDLSDDGTPAQKTSRVLSTSAPKAFVDSPCFPDKYSPEAGATAAARKWASDEDQSVRLSSCMMKCRAPARPHSILPMIARKTEVMSTMCVH